MIVYVQDRNSKPLIPTKRLGMVRCESFTIRLIDLTDSHIRLLKADEILEALQLVDSLIPVSQGPFEIANFDLHKANQNKPRDLHTNNHPAVCI